MKLINKLERKLEKYAIPNLMLYIIISNVITFAFMLNKNGEQLINNMILLPEKVLAGEWWRLFTFIFIPFDTNLIWFILMCFVYYSIGRTIEQLWGTFKFNLYYLCGALSAIIASLITGFQGTTEYLNLSLFLILAKILPESEALIYFIVPIKMKYLALFYWIIIFMDIVSTHSINYTIYILIQILPYIIFFRKDIIRTKKKKRYKTPNIQIINNVKNEIPKNYTIHKCTVCGKTEKDDPNLEFRFCSKCTGFHEYCMEHIKDHKHFEEKEKEN